MPVILHISIRGALQHKVKQDFPCFEHPDKLLNPNVSLKINKKSKTGFFLSNFLLSNVSLLNYVSCSLLSHRIS